MTKSKGLLSPTVTRAGQVVFTIVLLGVLWRVAGGQQVSIQLTSVQPVWVIAGFAALTLQTLISAIRWRITAAQLGLMLPLGLAIREYYLSQIINQALPGGVLGDVGRAVRSRGPQGLAAASLAVIFERLAGQIALFHVMTVAFAATFMVPGGLEWPKWTVGIVSAIICGGITLGAVFIASAYVPSPWRKNASRLVGKLGQALFARKIILAQVGLSYATTVCNLVAFAFCARAVGVVLSPVVICALVPLILFTMLIPLTVMGWGLREGAAATLLPIAGVTASAGFAASIVFGLTVLLATLPGLLVVWTTPKQNHLDAST